MTTTPAGRRRLPGEIRTYGEGRVCAEGECRTWLSRYNSSPYCAPHAGLDRGPAKEPGPTKPAALVGRPGRSSH